MKAITLHQPYASMIAVGAKTIETRSWPTSYRGPLAIHAAKSWPAYAKAFALTSRFVRSRLADMGEISAHVPFGAVVAVGYLTGVVSTDRFCDVAGDLPLSEEERALGDYTPGRWAWQLAFVKPLRTPYPISGAQRLWDIAAGDAEVIRERVAEVS